jgi:hypothetical protein
MSFVSSEIVGCGVAIVVELLEKVLEQSNRVPVYRQPGLTS